MSKKIIFTIKNEKIINSLKLLTKTVISFKEMLSKKQNFRFFFNIRHDYRNRILKGIIYIYT